MGICSGIFSRPNRPRPSFRPNRLRLRFPHSGITFSKHSFVSGKLQHNAFTPTLSRCKTRKNPLLSAEKTKKGTDLFSRPSLFSTLQTANIGVRLIVFGTLLAHGFSALLMGRNSSLHASHGACPHSHSAPLEWRSTYFPRGILSAHSPTQQWYVVVT